MYSSSATAQDAYSATYKRYKTDTDTIAAWLLTTAKDRGYNVTGLHEPSAGPRTGSRPKGKARTAAKQAQVNADTVQNVVVKTYRINIPDFVALAQYIAKLKKPRVKTPDYLAHSLHQAIKGRKRLEACHNTYQKLTETGSSVDGHAFFIGVLEQVRGILGLEARCTLAQAGTEASQSLAAARKDNVFDHLALEEPSNLLDGPAATATPAHSLPESSSIKVVVDNAKDDSEAFLASALLSAELHRLRMTVRVTWELYVKGDIDLVAASITTNTAIDFCRRLQ